MLPLQIAIIFHYIRHYVNNVKCNYCCLVGIFKMLIRQNKHIERFRSA